ncbi:MAG: UDP-3-O-(3-hydroxymyristoyl)glucosamine N-acyltransferase [Bacteroidota bacterium]|nr:UDP-3-O-(3-hydroxymyristoyl)glucosamine N-acyltransferase [Bacteroidota bacterium]
MKFTAKQISDLLGGKVEGDENIEVTKLSKIEEGVPGTLSFLANPLYTHYIYTTNASIVIVNNSFVPENKVNSTLIRVENAYQSFAKLLEIYNTIKNNKTGVSKHAYISDSAKVGENVYIGEFAVISDNVFIGNNVKIYPHTYIGDNTTIGENTKIFSGVNIYSDNQIGKNCTIHSGVVIGGDGFGFAQQKDHNYVKVTQTGNVIIEDDVEIGANSTIDRATLGSTFIRRGVKIDNLIQIAHNVEIGENTVIAAQTGVAGSTKIGKNCMIGGQVGIVGHLTIADNVIIAAQSGIGSNITKSDIVQGSPAFKIGDYRKSYVIFRNFPKIQKRIEELEKIVKKLTSN